VAVDPGKVTGVGRGVFDLTNALSIRDAIEAAREVETWECDGDLTGQADEITEELEVWLGLKTYTLGVSITNLVFVMEDFHLRQRSADLTPVELRALIKDRWNEGWVPIQDVQPSHAKGYATNKRLRDWGIWVKGSEHRRDVMRHLIYKVNQLMGEQ
jgi:hypothetical protein